MLIRLRHYVLSLFLGASSLALAKDPPTPPPPPMAQPVELAMYRGHSTDIPLRALGRAPSQLQFLIRSRPRFGTLGEIRLVDEKNAVVTYTHDEKAGEGTDSFLFAVQAADGPVSASAPVSIVISEEPPVFRTSPVPDFGTIAVGETREGEITIANKGGGVISGQMEVDPPWKILGSPDYHLVRQQEQKVHLLFTPTEERQYNGKLVFSRDVAATLVLEGHAVQPFELIPADTMELATPGKDLARSGVLRIRNHTDRAQTIDLTAPAQVIVAPQVIVEAGGETVIPLQTIPHFLGAYHGELKLKSAAWEHSLPLHVFAVKPILEVEPASGLNFGNTHLGHRYQSDLRIKNTGGLDAQLILTLPPELALTPPAEASVLKAGETRTMTVLFEPQAAGDWTGEIKAQIDGGTPLSIPVQANVASSVFERPLVSNKAAVFENPPAPSPFLPPIPGLEASTETFNATAPIKEIESGPAEVNEVELSWRKPGPHAMGYIVESREIKASSAAPIIQWTEWKDAKFHEENDLGFLRLEGLPPGRLWYIRISSLDEAGKRSAPSPTIRIATRTASPFTFLWWLAGAVVLLAAGFATKFLRKYVTAQNAQQDARIERLGKS